MAIKFLMGSFYFVVFQIHEEDIVGMGISCNGRFIMSCSCKNLLVVWDLKGQELAQIDTYLMNTICARISPCGRYIVASGKYILKIRKKLDVKKNLVKKRFGTIF